MIALYAKALFFWAYGMGEDIVFGLIKMILEYPGRAVVIFAAALILAGVLLGSLLL